MPYSFPGDLPPVFIDPARTEAYDGDVENRKAVDGGVIADIRSVASQEDGVAQNRYQDGDEHLDTRAVIWI